MQANQIPAKFSVAFASGAGGGYIRSIPTASQINVGGMAGAASLTDGFPPLCFLPVGSGGIPPAGVDFNGILNQITAWSRWQAAGALPQYDATFSAAIGGYPFGSVLASTTGGTLWLSTADNNTTNPDGSSPSGWVAVGTSSTQIVNYVTTNRVPSNARRVTNNARISLSGTGGAFYTAISSFLDTSGNPYTKLGPGTGTGATVLKATGFIGSYTPAVGGAGATYARLTDGTRTDTQPLCGNVNLSGVGPVGIPGFVEFWLVGVPAGVVNLQALVGRLDASTWASIINADGVDYGGTGSHTGTGSLSYLDIEELIP